MIKSLRLRNFRSFGDATIHFGRFSVLVGENATGKSNIGDALRVLLLASISQDLNDMFDGRGQPIRDGADSASLEVAIPGRDGRDLGYRIVFAGSPAEPRAVRIVGEELLLASQDGKNPRVVSLKRPREDVIPELRRPGVPTWGREWSLNPSRIGGRTALMS